VSKPNFENIVSSCHCASGRSALSQGSRCRTKDWLLPVERPMAARTGVAFGSLHRSQLRCRIWWREVRLFPFSDTSSPSLRRTMSSSIDIPSTERDSLDLQKGWPSLDLLPLSKIQAASSAIFSDPPTALAALQYGTLLGDSRLRKNLAEWLTKFYSVQRSPDPKRICITGGASQNFTSILQRFADPTYTRNVWMAAPTYFLASRMLEDAGYKGKLRAVPQADEGMDVNYLRQELARTEEFAPARPTANSISKPSSQYPKIYRHLIYAVPTFSNPTSLTMSLDRR
jgi:DNA-binding transcriptional MocR family regulator